jgi:hypothetical protein
LRRLEAEAVRDAILAVSGALNRSHGGPPVPLDPRPDGQIAIAEKSLSDPSARWRRSLYLLQRRNYPLSMLGVFDVPLMNTNCARRVNSVVPLQALAMMNSAFATEQASQFADRLFAEEPSDSSRRVGRGFLLALGRTRSDDELRQSLELIDNQRKRHLKSDPRKVAEAERRAWADLCLMLMNTNEFIYIE